MTIEISIYEEESVWKGWLQVGPHGQRDANLVVTVRRMVEHTDKQEVVAEGKCKALRGVWRAEGSTRTMTNCIIDVLMPV